MSIRNVLLLISLTFLISSCMSTKQESESGIGSYGKGSNNKTPPLLLFSDIISGPQIGLNDSLGEGSIVTIWGQNLRSSQGDSKIKIKDSSGNVFDVAHVYYWKNADGELPSGPANLYKSHKMQELAFSIPSSAALGLSKLYIVLNGEVSNKLDFTVRPGAIKWVAPSGNNSNECSFSNPCAYINGTVGNYGETSLGNGRLNPGDIIYTKGNVEPDSCGGGKCAAMYLRVALGTLEEQIAFVSYPGTVSKIISQNSGLVPYQSSGIVLSKYEVQGGHLDDPILVASAGNPSATTTQVRTSKNGRTVGNYLIDVPGKCSNGWGGAIVSGGESGSNHKVFGNHIYEIGCDKTSRFHHTTYMSVRNESSVVQGWEYSYNFLEDNKAMFGIHFYDETYSGDCGNVQGTLKITNNVIVNQKGAGINVGTRDLDGVANICWTANIEIENNLLYNVGLGDVMEDSVANADSIRIGGDLGSESIVIKNNLVYGYSDAVSRLYSPQSALTVGAFPLANPVINITKNIFYSNGDYDFIRAASIANLDAGDFVSNNLFYSTAVSPVNAVISDQYFGSSVMLNPKISISEYLFSYESDSPLIIKANSFSNEYDLYGVRRKGIDIGPIEY